jgi:hypothetical protein
VETSTQHARKTWAELEAVTDGALTYACG